MCLTPEKTYSVFTKYGLDVVPHMTLGVYDDFGDLCKDLEDEFEHVQSQNISNEEEGAVLYLILRYNSEAMPDVVISLCKLKTLEYRLFRKMREKLRIFVEGNNYATS